MGGSLLLLVHRDSEIPLGKYVSPLIWGVAGFFKKLDSGHGFWELFLSIVLLDSQLYSLDHPSYSIIFLSQIQSKAFSVCFLPINCLQPSWIEQLQSLL